MPSRRVASKRASATKPKRGTSGSRTPGKEPPAQRWGPRADKGEGEAAVQTRIRALGEPSRSIMVRLHPLVMKHGPALQPTVRYGFAIYMRGKAMALIAAPRKDYVSFGYPTNARIHEEPIEFRSPDDIDEARVAAMVLRALE